MVTRGEKVGGGMDWEVGIGIYTLLYIKFIGNKDPPYSSGKSIPYCKIAYMGNEKNGHICICTANSLCCTLETNTTL